VTYHRVHHFCSAGEIWNGGGCLLQTPFLDNCNGLRTLMQQQQARMQAAEAARQSACSTSPGQECSGATSASESEAGRYRDLQNRYAQCRRNSSMAYPFSGSAFASSGHWSGLSFDRLQVEVSH